MLLIYNSSVCLSGFSLPFPILTLFCLPLTSSPLGFSSWLHPTTTDLLYPLNLLCPSPPSSCSLQTHPHKHPLYTNAVHSLLNHPFIPTLVSSSFSYSSFHIIHYFYYLKIPRFSSSHYCRHWLFGLHEFPPNARLVGGFLPAFCFPRLDSLHV